MPRTHGSALFTRGETQALVTTTLGMSEDEQRIESLEGLRRERFMLHYNFPPFSVGETGRIGTGRREVGHGKLAWRALKSSLPEKEKFPYTIRVVSEITESNGSSSMATVCGASLALMDAAVPIADPVAGIAMGLIKEKDEFLVLSDILGDEDHLGDMDFKVAGTKDGITSLQMDIKITGITFEIMEQALNQAKEGRAHILQEMNYSVHYLGRTSQKDLDYLYMAVDYCVMPSINAEGFGVSILESLLRNTPVIYTDSGGMGDFLRNIIPEYGYNYGDDNKLLEILSTAIKSKRSISKDIRYDEYKINYSFKKGLNSILNA